MARNYAITLIVLLVVIIGLGVYFAQDRTGTVDTDADRPRVSEDADTGRLNPESPAESPSEGTLGDRPGSSGTMDRSPGTGAGMSPTTPRPSAPNADMGSTTERD